MAEVRFTKHALERLFSRNISPAECLEICHYGEIIEDYPDDLPFPSSLKLKTVAGRALHVVTSKDGNTMHVITAYEPNSKLWSTDFRKRVK